MLLSIRRYKIPVERHWSLVILTMLLILLTELLVINIFVNKYFVSHVISLYILAEMLYYLKPSMGLRLVDFCKECYMPSYIVKVVL